MNAEQAIISYLNSVLPVPASADVPRPRPASFVTVERTGGALADVVVDRPELAVQCWAESRFAASKLALAVRAALTDAAALEAALPEVARASVESLYNFPDPDSRSARYQLTVVVTTA